MATGRAKDEGDREGGGRGRQAREKVESDCDRRRAREKARRQARATSKGNSDKSSSIFLIWLKIMTMKISMRINLLPIFIKKP